VDAGSSSAGVALVTGAARGIGRACADALAAAGWKLVVVDSDEQGLASLADRLGENAAACTGDVGDASVNERAVAIARSRFGGLDAAVANAGVTLAKLVDDTSDEDFDRLFDVNVRAVMHLAKASHRALAESRGSLTVVASKTGLAAQRQSPLYCATKGAAVQLARALALDWAPEGIRVNAVCPGIVDTPMLAEFIAALPEGEAARDELRTAQPLGRLATPAECAAVVLFLSTPGASFITGVALPVDGGFTAQ
jgi:meso-butanediol dehydrogenase / (S,S)-butanediol dehydrogenase / diacetyl reductase